MKVLAVLIGVALVASGVVLASIFNNAPLFEFMATLGAIVALSPWVRQWRESHGLPMKLPENENPTIAVSNWRKWVRPIAVLGSFIVAAILFAVLRGT